MSLPAFLGYSFTASPTSGVAYLNVQFNSTGTSYDVIEETGSADDIIDESGTTDSITEV